MDKDCINTSDITRSDIINEDDTASKSVSCETGELHTAEIPSDPTDIDETNTEAEIETDPEIVSVSVADDEERDDDYYASIASRRRVYLAEVESRKNIEPAPPPKKTFISVISNFVYYHKILSVIIAVAIVALSVYAIAALCEKSYDYNIGIYTYNTEFSDEQIAEIEELFRTCGEDIDGDGVITVRINTHNPFADSSFISFIQENSLRRDIYGDWKYGSRVNNILITDEYTRDKIYIIFGRPFFDCIDGDSRWLALDTSEFPTGNTPDNELGIMLLGRNIYESDRQTAQENYSNAKEILERIREEYPELF